MRWMQQRWELRSPEEEPGLSGGEGGETSQEPDPTSLGNQSQEGDQPGIVTEPGSESPFTHPALVGMSEQELADTLATTTAAAKSQGKRLGVLERELQSVQAANQTPVVEPTPVDAQEFFANPGAVLPSMIGAAVKKEVQDIVAPLIADMATRGSDSAWTQARQRFPDIDQYQVHINETLASFNVQNPTFDTLKMAYTLARGEASIGGVNPRPDITPAGTQPPISPQHRPSNQPVRADASAPKARKLTEEESAMARSQKMSPEVFLAWMDADEDAIAESEIGAVVS